MENETEKDPSQPHHASDGAGRAPNQQHIEKHGLLVHARSRPTSGRIESVI
jgi:hypothetical protein